MSHWEEVCWYAANNPHGDSIVRYGCYIDDLLLVWNSHVLELPSFLDFLTSSKFNLTLTLDSHNSHINFLDVTLFGSCNKVETALYGNTLLCADSCHPTHTIRNLPIGEFVRAIRTCSNKTHFDQEMLTAQKLLIGLKTLPSAKIEIIISLTLKKALQKQRIVC